MSQVVGLKVVPAPEPDPEVVERCEQLLAMAKRGELTFFVLAGSLDLPGDPKNVLYVKAGPIRDLSVAVHALERAKLQLMGYVDQSDRAVPL